MASGTQAVSSQPAGPAALLRAAGACSASRSCCGRHRRCCLCCSRSLPLLLLLNLLGLAVQFSARCCIDAAPLHQSSNTRPTEQPSQANPAAAAEHGSRRNSLDHRSAQPLAQPVSNPPTKAHSVQVESSSSSSNSTNCSPGPAAGRTGPRTAARTCAAPRPPPPGSAAPSRRPAGQTAWPGPEAGQGGRAAAEGAGKRTGSGMRGLQQVGSVLLGSC